MDQLGQIDVPHMQTNEEYTAAQINDMADSLMTGAAPATRTPAHKNKRKHNTLTLSDKYGIILRLDQGESSSALCREFNIGRSTLYDIKTNRAEIEKFVTSPSYVLFDRKTLKKGDYPEVEEALYSWYAEEKNRIQITGDLLKEKGKYFFSMIHKRDDFQASEGWLDKFKKRFGIRLSATVDSRQPIPADFVEPALVEISVDFSNKFLTVVEQQKLLPEQVYFSFGGIINCTNLPPSICHPFSSQIKDVAFMPCANVTGKHKLDLLVVGNNRPCSNLPESANYVVQENVDISATVLQEWYLERFIPSVIKYLKNQNLPKKSLLVVANISSFPDEVDMKIKTADGLMDVMFVPQFAADIFQNMGQDMTSTLKRFYKKRLLMDFLSKPFTRIDAVMGRYGVKEAVCNLVYAWQRVPPAYLANYWLQIWQAVAYSPEFRTLTENGAGNIEGDIEATISLFCSRHIPLSNNTVTPEELRTWLNLDFKSEPDDICLDPALPANSNLPGVSTIITCDDAVSAANTLLQWAEEQSVDQTEILVLKKLQEKALISSFHTGQSYMI